MKATPTPASPGAPTPLDSVPASPPAAEDAPARPATPPRMRLREPDNTGLDAADDGGMDIASFSDDELQPAAPTGMKRAMPEQYDEPDVKRRRTLSPAQYSDDRDAIAGIEFLPEHSMDTQLPAISAFGDALTWQATAITNSQDWRSHARRQLTRKELDSISAPGTPDTARALALLFGAAGPQRPAHDFIIKVIPNQSDRLGNELRNCGALPLGTNSRGETLTLYTNDFDVDKFKQSLLQIHRWTEEVQTLCQASEDDASHDDSGSTNLTMDGDALLMAIEWGDASVVKYLIDHDKTIDRTDGDGKDALMFAAERGKLAIVQLLSGHPDLDVNDVDDDNYSALAYAAQGGHVAVCTHLLRAGARVTRSAMGNPLILAADYGHAAVCQLLLRQGFDVDLTNEEEKTPLMLAASRGHLACCQVLREHRASVHAVDIDGWWALAFAAAEGHVDVFDFLVRHGSPLASNDGKISVFEIALAGDQAGIARRLLEANPALAGIAHDGRTPLIIATTANALRSAELLLQYGADLHEADDQNANALVHAATIGNKALIALFLKHGARVNSAEGFGYLALGRAAINNHLEIVEQLLRAGAPVMPTYPGHDARIQPIMNAILATDLDHPNRYGIAKLLLEHGVPVDEPDLFGNNALMQAVSKRATALMHLLIKHGAEINQINQRGKNAIQIAIEQLDNTLAEMDQLAAVGAVSTADKQRATLEADDLVVLGQAAGRQYNRGPLLMSAARSAIHPLTREILLSSELLYAAEPVDLRINAASAIDFPRLQYPVSSMGNCRHGDWDPLVLELQLAQAGLPSVVIDFMQPYLEALPELKSRLWKNSELSPQTNINRALVAGICAMAERLIVAGGQTRTRFTHFIDGLALYREHRAQGQPSDLAQKLQKITDAKVVCVANYGAQQEQVVIAPVFENLFQRCIDSTRSAGAAANIDARGVPQPGAVTATLQERGIYTVLAEKIDVAWRMAWLSAIAAHDTPGDIVAASSRAGTPPQSLLLPAFRRELATRINAPGNGILALPNARPEVAAIYADLIHRQLHMLAQFIDEAGHV